MNWNYLFTSFEGRINRRPFWMGIIVLVVISVVASILDLILNTPRLGVSEYSGGTGLIGIVVGILEIWPSLALSVKRWHDRNKSGWWVLINIIPFIGWIWSFVETGCLAGTPGPNRFGPDPLTNGLPAAA